MCEVVVFHEGDRVPLEVEDAGDFELLKLQLLSLFEVDARDQLLIHSSAGVIDGEETLRACLDDSAAAADGTDHRFALLHRRQGSSLVLREFGTHQLVEDVRDEDGISEIGMEWQRNQLQMRLVEAGAATLQGASAEQQRETMQMLRRVQSNASHVQRAGGAMQVQALKSIPVVTLYERAIEKQAQSGQMSFRDALLRQLVRWFKREFFKWTNNPRCEHCNSSRTKLEGGARPSAEERRGWAGMVEVYSCQDCHAVTRFPRYNNPQKLLETRQGRCGEWANCFWLCCVSMGFDVRHVHDWTDHVWVEVWSSNLGRWLHVDACEEAVDSPLLYESGWGKKLSYVIAFARDEVVDVTRRYTRKWASVQSRRTLVPEAWLSRVLDALSEFQMRTAQSPPVGRRRRMFLQARQMEEELELQWNMRGDAGARTAAELRGRQTGSLEWRRARGELGDHEAAPEGAAGAGEVSSSRLNPVGGWQHAGATSAGDTPDSEESAAKIWAAGERVVRVSSQRIESADVRPLLLPSATSQVAHWTGAAVMYWPDGGDATFSTAEGISSLVPWPPAPVRVSGLTQEPESSALFASTTDGLLWAIVPMLRLWTKFGRDGFREEPSSEQLRGWVARCVGNVPESTVDIRVMNDILYALTKQPVAGIELSAGVLYRCECDSKTVLRRGDRPDLSTAETPAPTLEWSEVDEADGMLAMGCTKTFLWAASRSSLFVRRRLEDDVRSLQMRPGPVRWESVPPRLDSRKGRFPVAVTAPEHLLSSSHWITLLLPGARRDSRTTAFVSLVELELVETARKEVFEGDGSRKARVSFEWPRHRLPDSRGLFQLCLCGPNVDTEVASAGPLVRIVSSPVRALRWAVSQAGDGDRSEENPAWGDVPSTPDDGPRLQWQAGSETALVEATLVHDEAAARNPSIVESFGESATEAVRSGLAVTDPEVHMAGTDDGSVEELQDSLRQRDRWGRVDPSSRLCLSFSRESASRRWCRVAAVSEPMLFTEVDNWLVMVARDGHVYKSDVAERFSCGNQWWKAEEGPPAGATTPSAGAGASGNLRGSSSAQLQANVKRLFRQLTSGCGRSDCTNPDCKSSSIWSRGDLSANAAASLAIRLARDGSAAFCVEE